MADELEREEELAEQRAEQMPAEHETAQPDAAPLQVPEDFNGEQLGIEEQLPQQAEARHDPLFFNAAKLPATSPYYVVWLDMMGATQAMAQSLFRSTNFIGRLHVAILKHINFQMQVMPFMDGAYIVTHSQSVLFAFLQGVFKELATSFLAAKPEHRFLSRCGVAYGNVICGRDIPTSVSIILGSRTHTWYREGILFGMRKRAPAP